MRGCRRRVGSVQWELDSVDEQSDVPGLDRIHVRTALSNWQSIPIFRDNRGKPFMNSAAQLFLKAFLRLVISAFGSLPFCAGAVTLHYELEEVPTVYGWLDYNTETRSVEDWSFYYPNQFTEFTPAVGPVNIYDYGDTYFLNFTNEGGDVSGYVKWYLSLEFTDFNRDAINHGFRTVYLTSYMVSGVVCNYFCTYPIYSQGHTGRLNSPIPEPATAAVFLLGLPIVVGRKLLSKKATRYS